MTGGSAETLARQKRRHPANGIGRFVATMPQRVRLHRPVLHQTLVNGPAQLVALRGQTIRRGIAPIGASFQHQRLYALHGELARNQRGGQSATDDDDAT